jgi:hypothetical protein
MNENQPVNNRSGNANCGGAFLSSRPDLTGPKGDDDSFRALFYFERFLPSHPP